MNEKRYRAVLFDLGGTLRIALEDEPYMRHARRKMTELAGAGREQGGWRPGALVPVAAAGL